jgi:hypothetical protein
MITVTLDEREARALASACNFTRIAFQQVGVALPPEDDKLASAHLKVLSALERQETPSGFGALGVGGPNPYVQRAWRANGEAA